MTWQLSKRRTGELVTFIEPILCIMITSQVPLYHVSTTVQSGMCCGFLPCPCPRDNQEHNYEEVNMH